MNRDLVCQRGPPRDANAVHSELALHGVDHLLASNLQALALGDGRIIELEARIGALEIEASACLAVGVADPARPRAGQLHTQHRVCDLNLITKMIRQLTAKIRIQVSVCGKAQDLSP